LSFAPVAKALGLATESPTTRAAMKKAVAKALKRGGATLIEVSCTRDASERCRARVAKAAVDALAREFR
jgi:2-succinyl-5-enolpyruvyl-6-hydroxy-3-cyclohexene-1-carboxylate synthase